MASAPVVTVSGPPVDRAAEVLTAEALAFVAELHRRVHAAGVTSCSPAARSAAPRSPAPPPWTSSPRPPRSAPTTRGRWPPAPAALNDRRVEITGPTDRKMTINALNSGARVWLADFEDASAPTWENVVLGQLNLIDAYERPHRLHRRPHGQVVRPEARRRARDRRDAPARLAPGRASPPGGRRAGARRAGRLRPVLLPQRRSGCSTSARARTSTSPRRSRTWRPGSGTTSSSSPRTTWASRRAPSARPC